MPRQCAEGGAVGGAGCEVRPAREPERAGLGNDPGDPPGHDPEAEREGKEGPVARWHDDAVRRRELFTPLPLDPGLVLGWADRPVQATRPRRRRL
jgi:hypothetical protein